MESIIEYVLKESVYANQLEENSLSIFYGYLGLRHYGRSLECILYAQQNLDK